jgi:hypothetical protein
MKNKACIGAILGLVLMIALALVNNGNLRELNVISTLFFIGGGAIAGYVLSKFVTLIRGPEKMSWALRLGIILFLIPIPFLLYALFSSNISGFAMRSIAFGVICPVPGFIIGAFIGRAIDRRGSPMQAGEVSHAIQKTVKNPLARFFNYFLK